MAELRIQGRPLEVGDTIVWAGDGWEPHALEARPHRVTHVHTDRIVRVAMGPTQSHNFVSGSTGWRIKEDGSAEFNDVTVRGTIYASAGEIGGWTIAATELYGGSGASRVGLRPGTYPFYAGAEDPASAPFRVTAAGALVATSATITGSITATSGTIGGWSITSTEIKSDSDDIILNKAGTITIDDSGYLVSDPFSSGSYGWKITSAEAEFQNVVVRGEIHTAVFKYDEVHAQAGRLLVTPNAAKLEADLTVAASGSFNVGETGRFAANDIVRLKDGTNDVWLTVTADGGDGTYNYTRSSGAGAGTVFRCGTGVIGYGASGEGGVMLDAQDGNGPFMDIFTHAGAPWTTITTKVRVGNLAGISDDDLDPSGYGFYTDNAYLKGDLVAGGGNVRVVSEGVDINFNPTGASAGRVKFTDFEGDHDGSVVEYAFSTDPPTGDAIWYYLKVTGDDETGSDTDARMAISAIAKGQVAIETGGGTGILLASYETPLATNIGALIRADETVLRLESQDMNLHARLDLEPDGDVLFDLRGAWEVGFRDYNTSTVVAKIDYAGEVFAKADGFGLMDRTTDCGCTVDDHFRSGSIPTGYSWAGAPFSGTPANLDYDYRGSYLQCFPNAPGANERYFLYDSVTAYANRAFRARIGCGHNSRVGIRIDDGSDDNYRELYLDPNATTVGLYDLVVKSRDGGGAATTTTVIGNLPFVGRFFVMRLVVIGSVGNWTAYQYFVSEVGVVAGIGAVGGAATWDVSRVGVIIHEGQVGYGEGYCDYIYSQFS